MSAIAYYNSRMCSSYSELSLTLSIDASISKALNGFEKKRSFKLKHLQRGSVYKYHLRSLSICPDQAVFKWNARVLRTGSGKNGPAHGSERPSSPASVVQSTGIWKVVARKICAHAWSFSFITGQNQSISFRPA